MMIYIVDSFNRIRCKPVKHQSVFFLNLNDANEVAEEKNSATLDFSDILLFSTDPFLQRIQPTFYASQQKDQKGLL